MYYCESISSNEYEMLNPVQFGNEECKKSHHFGPAIRTFWLLHFVVSGKGIFKINGKTYPVSKGMLFVIPPFVETYYEADAQDPWNYIWVGFTAKKLPADLGDVISCPKALRIFEQIKRAQDIKSGKAELICAKLWELFSLLLENTEKKTDYIEEALNIIHSEYMLPLTIQQIATRLNLERTYFSSLFKKRLGITPKQYLLNHRMEQALILIKDHGYSITTSAYSVGYEDVYVFSKMFKKHFGKAPTKYQRNGCGN